METIGPLSEFIRDGGIIAGCILLGFAVHKRFLVLGRELEQCERRNDTLEALANKHADKLESRLDRFEAEREGTRVSPTA